MLLLERRVAFLVVAVAVALVVTPMEPMAPKDVADLLTHSL